MTQKENHEISASSEAPKDRSLDRRSSSIAFASQVNAIKERAKRSSIQEPPGDSGGFPVINRRPSPSPITTKTIGTLFQEAYVIPSGKLASSSKYRVPVPEVTAKEHQSLGIGESRDEPRSGKFGLDTYMSRMGQASVTMMDALARRHGVPYELSLPCLLHVLSLSLSPRLQIREEDFSSTPVLQIQVGAFPKAGKSLAYKAVVGSLHKLVDAGVFPDILQNDFTEIGLLRVANSDSWNSVGVSDPDGSQIIRTITGDSGKAAFALDFHAKGFCGERYERVTAESKNTIPHLHLGTLVMVQPERITEFFESARVREKGLINRTLQFQALEALPKKPIAVSVDQARDLLENHFRRFAAIRSAEKSAGFIPVTLSSEAREWLEGERTKSEQSVLRRDELGIRLAAILHTERIADRNPDGDLESLLKGTEIGLADLKAAVGLCDVCESYTRNAEIFSEEAHEKATHPKADRMESVLRAHGGSARIGTLVDELRMARKTINTLIMANPDRFEKGEPDYSGKKGQPAIVIRLVQREGSLSKE